MRYRLAATLEWLAWVLEDIAERVDRTAAAAVATRQATYKRAPLIERL